MANRPTEEDLGIAPTPEELEVLSRPPAPLEPDDDIPVDREDEEEVAATPQAEAPVRVKDPLTGKFVAKPKDGEAAPAADAAPATKAPPPGYTDIRALQEARAENKVLAERTNKLLELLAAKEAREAKKDEPAAPARPTLDGDPLGLVGDIDQRLTRFENETKAQAEARQAAERDEQEFQQVQSVAVAQFNEAAAADPTAGPTYNALLESFAKEICFINGIPANSAQMTPAQKDFVGNEMTKLERSHIRYAVSKGFNVADYMKNLAGVRNISVTAPQAAPAAAAPAASAQPGPKPIAERQAAQARHMSIGDLPGSAAPSQISAKDLAKMSPKEFAAFAKQLGDAGLDEMFAKA